MATGAAGAFNWGTFGAGALGAVGNIAGGYLEGQGQKAGMEALAGANKEAARMGFMGSAMKLNDERAARAGQYAQNVFGQLAAPLYNAPIAYAWQRRGKEEDLGFKARQFAMAREEDRLGEEQLQTPLFKRSREEEARMDRLAGRYAAALPAMTQYGQFNLPNV
jgi:hypothetical protein